ncbi:helix-turn-helix transcriptional regulator [Nocardia asteroides]
MTNAPARMLRLLSLLQNSRDWPGSDLAARLDVSRRTLRRDIDRLRDLGYPVSAVPGVGGGYRLEAGATIPPLLLDDEEAVAVAIGLRTAASGTVAGIEEASIGALTKLQRMLPNHLSRQVNALHAFTFPFVSNGPTVDPDHLTLIAQACRDHERLRFAYRKKDATETKRLVEPYRLVHVTRKWYLVAWDLNRDDWRTFRVDRLNSPLAIGVRFQPRQPPFEDAAGFVADSITSSMARYQALVLLQASAEQIAEWLPPTYGVLEPIDDTTCRFRSNADSLKWLALTLGMFDVDFEILEPPELIEYAELLSARLARAAQAGSVATGIGEA